MNIEKQERAPTEEEVRIVEDKIRAFIDKHPGESAELGISPEEERLAAGLISKRLANSGKSAEDVDDDMVLRALEARRDVRGSEKIPVWDSQGVVIGTVSSPEEAKKMAQLENEERDLG
jgi:hypothetical protein